MSNFHGQIYAVTDSQDPERVRYVGQTRVGIPKRERGHWYHVTEGRNLPISDWLRKRSTRRADVIFSEIDTASNQEDLNEREIFWIAYYRELGQADLNLFAGGQYRGDWTISEETRALLQERRRYGGVASATVTVEDVLEIRRLSASGEKDTEIANSLDIGVQAVGHILRGESWGYVPWEEGTSVRENKRKPPLSETQWEDIYQRVSEGNPVTLVAQEYGVAPRSISKRLGRPEVRERYKLDSPEVVEARKASKYGLTSVALRGTNTKTSKLTEREVEKIKRMIWEGHPFKEIGAEFGVTVAVIGNISCNAAWTHVPWPIGPRPKPKKGFARTNVP